MTFKTRMSVLALSTPVLAFVLVGGLMGANTAQTSTPQTYQHLRVFDDVVELVMNNYVTEVQVDKVMDGAMRGLADGLDPDSAFLSPGQVKSIESGEAPPDADVGIELTRRYYLYVIAARDGSPALKAGLRTADTIRAIDGKPTRDMSVFEGTRALRGKLGTKVTLTIIRGNAADPHEVVLVRDKVAGPIVTSKLIGSTGYLRIASFRNGVVEELRKQSAESDQKRSEESDRRRSPHRRRPARKRHRGGPCLHQVRNSGHQVCAHQDRNARAGIGRRW